MPSLMAPVIHATSLRNQSTNALIGLRNENSIASGKSRSAGRTSPATTSPTVASGGDPDGPPGRGSGRAVRPPARIDPGGDLLAQPIEHDGQDDDRDPGIEHRADIVADQGTQRGLSEPGGVDERRDDDHRHGQHQRLVEGQGQLTPGKRQADPGEQLPPGRPERAPRLDGIGGHVPDAQRRDPDRRRHRVDEGHDRRRRRADPEEQHERRQVGERRHDLHDIEDRRQDRPEPGALGHEDAQRHAQAERDRHRRDDRPERVHARIPQPHDPDRGDPRRRARCQPPAAGGQPDRAEDGDQRGPAHEVQERGQALDQGIDADPRDREQDEEDGVVAVVADGVAQVVEGREEGPRVGARLGARPLEDEVERRGHHRQRDEPRSARHRARGTDGRHGDGGHRSGGPIRRRRPGRPPSSRSSGRPACRPPRPGCGHGRRRRADGHPRSRRSASRCSPPSPGRSG